MKHSEGDWEISSYRYGEIWIGADHHIATCHKGTESEEKMQANARLIAAAPKLLKTLKAILKKADIALNQNNMRRGIALTDIANLAEAIIIEAS